MSDTPAMLPDGSAAARAPVVGSSRPCPGCGGILPEGRKACSGKCRAALSRQRRAEAQAEQLHEVHEFLVRALTRLGETR